MSGRPKHASSPPSAAEEMRQLIREAHEACQAIKDSLKEAEKYVDENAAPELHKQLHTIALAYADNFQTDLNEAQQHIEAQIVKVEEILLQFKRDGYTLRLISDDLIPLMDDVTRMSGGSIQRGFYEQR